MIRGALRKIERSRVVRIVPGKLCASATVGMLESLLMPERKSLQEPEAG